MKSEGLFIDLILWRALWCQMAQTKKTWVTAASPFQVAMVLCVQQAFLYNRLDGLDPLTVGDGRIDIRARGVHGDRQAGARKGAWPQRSAAAGRGPSRR